MKIFLSSTFRDLRAEREAVLSALQKYQQNILAMEYFLATPETPLDTALQQLRKSDVVLLVVGFHAGSLLPDGSGKSYTEAEYEQAKNDEKPILAFLQMGKRSKKWQNRETRKENIEALNRFKQDVESRTTRFAFETPDQLVSAVLLSLSNWENRGRPGARRTFASPFEFFRSKVTRPSNPIFDFSQTLVGRKRSIESLTTFLASDSQSICVFSGRGGIGKSKLLHDWSDMVTDYEVVFLKESPLWDADAHKELSRGPVVIVVDDAHRPKGIEKLIQLFTELRGRQAIKLVLSTRPGGIAEIEQILYRSFPSEAIAQMQPLDELSPEEAEALASEVLGERLRVHARLLAEASDNTPLVIVAGARMIGSHQINPAEMATMQDFRLEVFSRFYDELNLKGPQFPINPPRQLLQIISAIGPLDTRNEQLLRSVNKFLHCSKNDILTTLDQLAIHGVVTSRDEPVRVIPDVLSDYVLEVACVGAHKLDTGYVDKIFKRFREHSFRNLMQNLSELDWRLDRIGFGLERMEVVWRRIFASFRIANVLERRKVIEDLAPAAAYQPSKILELVRLARNLPIVEDELSKRLRAKREYLIEALPRLLGVVTYYPDHISQSVDHLWDLSIEEADTKYRDRNAQHVLRRLASYRIYKSTALNFAMLLQCVRLSQRPDAFDRAFTPLDILDEMLEREGEFNEARGYQVSFGGFGLPYDIVGPVRQNALDFLESLLSWERCAVAVRALTSLGSLLHRFLNRVGRESTIEEIAWQDAERLRVLSILERRLNSSPVSLPVRRGIMSTLRSATGVTSPEQTRERAQELLDHMEHDADLLIFDAVCTGDHNFPITSTDDAAGSWTVQSRAQLTEACTALSAKFDTSASQATELVSKVKLAYRCNLEPRGYPRILAFLSYDSSLQSALVDCISADPEAANLIQELSTALLALHASSPVEFRLRARQILRRNLVHEVTAAAGALRVHASRATEEDVSLIEDFLHYPNAAVKRAGLHAVAYLGQNQTLQPSLLHAVLSLEVDGNPHVATDLADAFGSYGVSLELLTREEVSRLLDQFLPIEDLDQDQGRIPALLNRLATVFPEQVLGFLVARIEIALRKRAQGDWHYRAIRCLYGHVSFGNVERSTKLKLVSRCLELYLEAEPPADLYRDLFWGVLGGMEDDVLSILVDAVDDVDENRLSQLLLLIQTSPGRLVPSNSNFARSFLAKLSGEHRRQAVSAFVSNAQPAQSGFGAAPPDRTFENQRQRMDETVSNFPEDAGLEDLYKALHEAAANAPRLRNAYGLEDEP